MKRAWLVLLVFVMLFSSGCAALGMDVETQLRPPLTAGGQEEIQKALGAYIADSGMQDKYVLKYPKTGQYRSAFIVEDLDGDGNEEALAFYRTGPESNLTHINLLRQAEGQWRSVFDIEGIGTDIDSVTFGDLNGDGCLELFVGWSMYNSRNYQLVLYSLSSNVFTERFSDSYSALVVGSLTERGRDDFLLLRISAETGGVTAQLWSMQEDFIIQRTSIELDAYIQQFLNIRLMPLSDTVNGVYVDCVRSDGMMTELLYWDGSVLKAPFYGTGTNGAPLTLRPVRIPSSDIDGDGQLEWPRCRLLPGYETTEGNNDQSVRWITTFSSWDFENRQPVDKFSCIYNSADGYYLGLQEQMMEGITTTYDAGERLLELCRVEDWQPGEAFLAIKTESLGASDGESSEPEDEREFLFLAESNAVRYSVWISETAPYSLNMESVRYMLTMLLV